MKYQQDYPNKLREEAKSNKLFGATISDIASLFHVNRRIIYAWMEKYPAFKSAVDDIREEVDERVENALLKNALGYDYDETRTVRGYRGDLDVNETVTTTRHKPGSVAAQKLWLTNRKAGRWSEKPAAEEYGNVSVTFVNDIPEEEVENEDIS